MYEATIRAGDGERLNTALVHLERCGIAPSDGLAMIASVQALALGWVAFGNAAPAVRSNYPLDTLRYPQLSAAERKHKYDEASLRRALVAVIEGFEKLYMGESTPAQNVNGRARAK